jgi:hypothetical protein
LPAQNVGIGVSSPKSMLSVNGTTSSGGLAIGDSEREYPADCQRTQ